MASKQPRTLKADNLTNQLAILKFLEEHPRAGVRDFKSVLANYPKNNSGFFKHSELLHTYRRLAGKSGLKPLNPQIIKRLKLKPTRTLSGVTPVTVLTKPYPCPGNCIFCPSDVRMPKSYLPSEPGAQRAAHHAFDPYLQTYNRLIAFQNIGHNISKVELLVLGGTWSVYPLNYRRWFITRCFTALNDFGQGIDQRATIKPSYSPPKITPVNPSYNHAVGQNKASSVLEKATWKDVESEHRRNQASMVRCVGLVLETRPDYLTPKEVINLRRLGCTKVQVGLQSLDDHILSLNHRGHSVKDSIYALKLLRLAGFKIHAHLMPNLYGSNPQKDYQDYLKLFLDPDFKPDELKIYPTSLISHTPLMDYYHQGKWRPYTYQQLLDLLVKCLSATPEYCRLSRVVRDIPSPDIVAGNKFTNFRQIAEKQAKERGLALSDIRFREIRSQKVNPSDLTLKTLCYQTGTSIEYFLQYINFNNQIAGFLRLSLPTVPQFINELMGASIIREVHVYGTSLKLGQAKTGAAQHLGLGKKLIKEAEKVAQSAGYPKIAVISAVGTIPYYGKLGYRQKRLYQIKTL